MYRIELSDEQRQELQGRCRAAGLPPRTRDRLEMVRLSAAGWRVPRIATHLGLCEKRVRHWIKRYLTGGFDALPDQPHPGRSSALTPTMLAAVRTEIARGERTWNAAQLAAWLQAQFGVQLSASHLRLLLRRAKLTYKRTSRSLQHKQKPAEVAAKQQELESLEKRGPRA